MSRLEKILNGEIVDENLPVPAGQQLPKRHGSLSIRNRRIAEMAARGWSPEEIAKEVKLRQDRVYEILKTDEVWGYVKEIIKDIFSEGDRILAFLYKKAMKGLDDDLLSNDPDIRKAAREQVLKCAHGGEKSYISLIQQIYTKGGELGTGSMIDSIDDLILKKRKERGLAVESSETDEIEMEEDKLNGKS